MDINGLPKAYDQDGDPEKTQEVSGALKTNFADMVDSKIKRPIVDFTDEDREFIEVLLQDVDAFIGNRIIDREGLKNQMIVFYVSKRKIPKNINGSDVWEDVDFLSPAKICFVEYKPPSTLLTFPSESVGSILKVFSRRLNPEGTSEILPYQESQPQVMEVPYLMLYEGGLINLADPKSLQLHDIRSIKIGIN